MGAGGPAPGPRCAASAVDLAVSQEPPGDGGPAVAGKKTSKPPKARAPKDGPEFQLGDRVKIRHSGGLLGRIVELPGPLGPHGMQIYRVRVRRKPKPAYIELRGDQLALVPAKN